MLHFYGVSGHNLTSFIVSMLEFLPHGTEMFGAEKGQDHHALQSGFHPAEKAAGPCSWVIGLITSLPLSP